MLNESGDEEEQDAIVNQVLDEIGIEISGKVRFLTRPFHKFCGTVDYRPYILRVTLPSKLKT